MVKTHCVICTRPLVGRHGITCSDFCQTTYEIRIRNKNRNLVQESKTNEQYGRGYKPWFANFEPVRA